MQRQNAFQRCRTTTPCGPGLSPATLMRSPDGVSIDELAEFERRQQTRQARVSRRCRVGWSAASALATAALIASCDLREVIKRPQASTVHKATGRKIIKDFGDLQKG